MLLVYLSERGGVGADGGDGLTYSITRIVSPDPIAGQDTVAPSGNVHAAPCEPHVQNRWDLASIV